MLPWVEPPNPPRARFNPFPPRGTRQGPTHGPCPSAPTLSYPPSVMSSPEVVACRAVSASYLEPFGAALGGWRRLQLERRPTMNTEQFNAHLDHLDRLAVGYLNGWQKSHLLARRAKRRPVPFTDDHGTACLQVPLNKHRTEYATIELTDWLELQDLGATGLWCLSSNGRGTMRVKTRAPMQAADVPSHIFVVRLILDLRRGERARFNNGDPADLRRQNLRVEMCPKSSAKNDARSMARNGAACRARLSR